MGNRTGNSPQHEKGKRAPSRALLVALIAATVTACNGAATVGDAITERIGDTRLEIELVEVHNPAELDPEDEHAPLPDARLVAVELHLRNVGDAAYHGEVRPRPATRVTAEDGTRHFQDGLSDASVTECDDTISALTLAPGEAQTGCVIFGLEPGQDGGELETFQLMLEGEGARPVRWQLNN